MDTDLQTLREGYPGILQDPSRTGRLISFANRPIWELHQTHYLQE
jgi:hypothetical protein